MSDTFLSDLFAAFDARDAARAEQAAKAEPELSPFARSLIAAGVRNKCLTYGLMGGVEVLCDDWLTDEQVAAAPVGVPRGILDEVTRVVVVARYDPADYRDEDS